MAYRIACFWCWCWFWFFSGRTAIAIATALSPNCHHIPHGTITIYLHRDLHAFHTLISSFMNATLMRGGYDIKGFVRPPPPVMPHSMPYPCPPACRVRQVLSLVRAHTDDERRSCGGDHDVFTRFRLCLTLYAVSAYLYGRAKQVLQNAPTRAIKDHTNGRFLYSKKQH